MTIGLENQLASPDPKVACSAEGINLSGRTAKDIGMVYDTRATVVVPGLQTGNLCSHNNADIIVPKGQKEIIVMVAAGTDYDSSKGNAASGFSFRGHNPHSSVLHTTKRASGKPYYGLKACHINDFSGIFGQFTLDLPDPKGSASEPSTELISSYAQPGDPFVENLLFDYGRYLFISSSRPGSLPPNLQGLWTEQMSPSWGADYHANINLEMNHWSVEQVGLGEQTEPLWAYMANTWMPRGAETAKLLYGTSDGWVTHDEMNVFGHTA